MEFLEYLGLILSGAGVLGSILGIFFAVYAKYNGKMTRDFIASQNREVQNSLRELIKETQNLIATEMRETRKLLSKMDERAVERHREVIQLLSHQKS